MEGRHTALDEWQLESWAKSIDSCMGKIRKDKGTGEWYMNDRQYERIVTVRSKLGESGLNLREKECDETAAVRVPSVFVEETIGI